jgi:tetratricopeptide (TPR) repeat protein
MPGTITSYSILLELPDELVDERRAFGDVVHAFNETDAVPRGALFIPLGWEPGVASSPSVLHDDFREIDYLVLVLWDRWTSRMRSEYELASRCLASPNDPMRQVVPFFKSVAPRQLEDPGEQLKQVRELRDKLEADRKSVFEMYATVADFESRLRWHLSRWLIDHEKRSRPATAEEPSSGTRPVPAGAVETEPVTHPLTDEPESYNKYGLFLQRQGMLEDAEATHRRVLELSGDQGASAELAIAYGNLGVICHRQRRFDEAEAMLMNALAICEQLGLQRGMAAGYSGLGLLYRTRNDLARAEAMFRSALEVEQALDRSAGIASCYGNLALIADFRDEPTKAEKLRGLARAVGEEPEYPLGELFPQEI